MHENNNMNHSYEFEIFRSLNSVSVERAFDDTRWWTTGNASERPSSIASVRLGLPRRTDTRFFAIALLLLLLLLLLLFLSIVVDLLIELFHSILKQTKRIQINKCKMCTELDETMSRCLRFPAQSRTDSDHLWYSRWWLTYFSLSFLRFSNWNRLVYGVFMLFYLQ